MVLEKTEGFLVKARFLLLLLMVAVPLCYRACREVQRFGQASRLRQRADELQHLGKLGEALALLQQARVVYPSFLDIYQEMAEIHLELGHYQQAYACVNEAVLRCPRTPESLAIVYRQRGFCQWRSGQWAGAAADFRTSLRYNRGETFSRRLLEELERRGHLAGQPVPSPEH